MVKRNNIGASPHFRIADMLVQPNRLMVVRDGKETLLEPRLMEVLIYLAERAGVTVGTRELIKDVWHTNAYGPNPVHANMTRLRQAIGDNPRNPRIIETVVGIGYRVIAQVWFPAGHLPKAQRDEPWNADQDSPYVGLAAYDMSHASVFHGRRTLTTELLDAMRTQMENGRRFVLIDGPSGCGKSSVLRAGALPALLSEHGVDGMRTLAVSVCNLAAMTDGDAIAAIARALATLALNERPIFPPQPVESLKRSLIEAPESISSFIEEAFRRHTDRKMADQHLAHVMLVIDHAETLVAREPIDQKIVEPITRILRALCSSPHALIVMIARRDAYPRLMDGMPDLKELKAGKGHVEVFPPRRSEIADIIVRPAAQASLRFEAKEGRLDDVPYRIDSIETNLAHDERYGRLDYVIYEAATRHPDALPLLQHTLHSLYEKRQKKDGMLTFAAYEEIGGLEGAIAHRAEEVFSGLPQETRNTLGDVLKRLVIVQPDTDIVGTQSSYSDTLPAAHRSLVQAFIDARLFVAGLDAGRPNFGVAHEALLRQWPLAKNWISDNRRLLQAKTRLKRHAKHWVYEGRKDDHLLNPGSPLTEAIEIEKDTNGWLSDDERELIRRSSRKRTLLKRIKLMVMIALSIMTTISIFMTITAFRSRDEAITQRAKSSDMTSFVIGELGEKLDPLADLELLERIGSKVLAYCANLDLDDARAEELVSCSKAGIKVGEVQLEQSRVTDAESLFRMSLGMSERAEILDPGSSEATMASGRAYSWLGRIKHSQGSHQEAIHLWVKFLGRTAKLIEMSPRNPKFLMEHSFALHNLGQGYHDLGNFTRAREYLDRSIAKKEEAISLANSNMEYKYELIVTESLRVGIDSIEGLAGNADRKYEELTGRLKAILEEKKNAADWERQLTSLLQLHASLLINMGDLPKAKKKIDESIKLLSALVEKEPKNQTWRRLLGKAFILSSDIDRFNANIPMAKANLTSARAMIQVESTSSASLKRINSEITFRHGFLLPGNAGESLMSNAISDMEKILSTGGGRYSKLVLVEFMLLRASRLRRENRIPESLQDTLGAWKILSSFRSDQRDIIVDAYKHRAVLIGVNIDPARALDDMETRDPLDHEYRHPDHMIEIKSSSQKIPDRHQEDAFLKRFLTE